MAAALFFPLCWHPAMSALMKRIVASCLETALAAGAHHSLETRWTIIMIPMRFAGGTGAARQAGTPLVALESTLISHGLPHPGNIDVARRAEEAVRGAGAAPATMAVLDGVAHIGLDDAAITQLATQAGVVKLSGGAICRWRFQGLKRRRRPGPPPYRQPLILAQQAGIGVFTTGGIGRSSS